MGLVFSCVFVSAVAQPITKNRHNIVSVFFIWYLIYIITQKPIDATCKIT